MYPLTISCVGKYLGNNLSLFLYIVHLNSNYGSCSMICFLLGEHFDLRDFSTAFTFLILK